MKKAIDYILNGMPDWVYKVIVWALFSEMIIITVLTSTGIL